MTTLLVYTFGTYVQVLNVARRCLAAEMGASTLLELTHVRELSPRHAGTAAALFRRGTAGLEYKAEAYPGYMAPMIRPPHAEAVPGDRACALGMFGMVPHWAKFDLAHHTYNARTETVATKPTFRNAYKKRQFCIIPVHSFFEPNYETGKPVRWEIAQAERDPLGIAGIWEHRADGPNGLPLLSFSMLTVNADDDPLMQRFHKPVEEKRMPVILQPEQYDAWLQCPVEEAPVFFTRFPANQLTAMAAPRTGTKSAKSTDTGPKNRPLL